MGVKPFTFYNPEATEILSECPIFRAWSWCMEVLLQAKIENSSLNKNPADSLKKKKGDKYPVKDLVELANAVRPFVNTENKEIDSKKAETPT